MLTITYRGCITNQILIFGGYVKAEESLYTQIIIWADTIPNQLNT